MRDRCLTLHRQAREGQKEEKEDPDRLRDSLLLFLGVVLLVIGVFTLAGPRKDLNVKFCVFSKEREAALVRMGKLETSRQREIQDPDCVEAAEFFGRLLSPPPK